MNADGFVAPHPPGGCSSAKRKLRRLEPGFQLAFPAPRLDEPVDGNVEKQAVERAALATRCQGPERVAPLGLGHRHVKANAGTALKAGPANRHWVHTAGMMHCSSNANNAVTFCHLDFLWPQTNCRRAIQGRRRRRRPVLPLPQVDPAVPARIDGATRSSPTGEPTTAWKVPPRGPVAPPGADHALHGAGAHHVTTTRRGDAGCPLWACGTSSPPARRRPPPRACSAASVKRWSSS